MSYSTSTKEQRMTMTGGRNKKYSFTTKKDKWVKFEQEVKIPEDKNIDVAGMSIILPIQTKWENLFG